MAGVTEIVPRKRPVSGSLSSPWDEPALLSEAKTQTKAPDSPLEKFDLLLAAHAGREQPASNRPRLFLFLRA